MNVPTIKIEIRKPITEEHTHFIFADNSHIGHLFGIPEVTEYKESLDGIKFIVRVDNTHILCHEIEYLPEIKEMEDK